MPHRALTPLLGAALLAGLVVVPSTAHALPASRLLTQQGRLFDENQAAITGEHQLEFRVYDALTDGNLLWHEAQQVLLANGYYSVTLGTNNDNLLLDSVFVGRTVYLALVLDNGDAFTPRQLITAVPFAVQADVATSLQGGSVDSQSLSINGTQVVDASGNWVGPRTWLGTTLDGLSCTTGQVPTRTTVGWGCTTPSGGSGGTAYSAGTGIAISNTNQISVSLADGAVPLSKLGQSGCTDSQVIAWSASASAFACTTPSGGSTGTLDTAHGGTGLTTLGTAGQILQVNAGATALQYADPPVPRMAVNGFSMSNIPSGQAATPLLYQGYTDLGFLVPYAATLKALCVLGNQSITAGSGTFTVVNNGTNTAATVTVDSSSTNNGACYTAGNIAVAAGDVLKVNVSTNASWSGSAASFNAHFVLQ